MADDSLKNEQNGDDTWFLKIDEDSIFGPVSAEALLAWAEQGRIAPGNEISPDRTTWSKAEAIPSLKMEWMVEVADGDPYGPLNIRALADLLDDGTVILGANLTNAATGEETTVRDKLTDIMPALVPAAPAPTVDDTALKSAVAERARLKEDLAAAKSRHAAQLDELQARITELEAASTAAHAEREAAHASASEESKTLAVELDQRAGAEVRARQFQLPQRNAEAQPRKFQREAR